MSFPIVINLGVGRSGTTYIYNVLREGYGSDAHVMHEDLTSRRARMRSAFRCFDPARIDEVHADPTVAAWVEKLRALAQSRPVIVTGSTTSHLAPLLLREFGERLRTIHVHRHPLNVCAASYVGNWSVDWMGTPEWQVQPNAPVLSPRDPFVRFSHLGERWPGMDAFERMSYNWLERTSAGIEFANLHPQVPHTLLSAESQVFNSHEYLEVIAGYAGLPVLEPGVKQANRNVSWLRSLEERPLGTAWRGLRQIPDALELAATLGHDCSDEELERRAARYQLPPGLGSRVRHWSRFWQLRRECAALARRAGLLPPRRAGKEGADARPAGETAAEVFEHVHSRLRGRGTD